MLSSPVTNARLCIVDLPTVDCVNPLDFSPHPSGTDIVLGNLALNEYRTIILKADVLSSADESDTLVNDTFATATTADPV